MLFFVSVYCLVEEGYLYSVKAKRFLTYHPTKVESRIFLAAENIRPKKFRINELKPPHSGSVRLTPVEREPGDVVLDKSGYNNDLIQFAENGQANQIFTLEMLPKMLVKLKSDGMCFNTPVDKYYLRAEECVNFEKEPGQYFRWISDGLATVISNPSIIENLIKSQKRKFNRSDVYDREENACINDKPKQSQTVDIPDIFDMAMLSNINPNPKPKASLPRNPCRPESNNYNWEEDELLWKLHQFDRIMLGAAF